MIWEKGISISSSPVLNNLSNLAMNSSWTLCVSLRFSSAFPRVTLWHSAGGCLRCRLSESQRAKKSPRSLQKEILGCVSVLQCRLKSSHVLSVGLGVLGQRRHLISRTEPRAQSLAWLRAALLFLLLLLHRAADVVNQFLHTHPQPKSALRPLLLETRSQQGSMVNSLRVRGREPLRSVSRFLGFVIDLWIWDPGHRLEAGPGRGPCCPQDLFYLAAPDSCRSGPLRDETHSSGVYQGPTPEWVRTTPLGICRHQY